MDYSRIRKDAEDMECCGDFSDSLIEEVINKLNVNRGDKTHIDDLEFTDIQEKIRLNVLTDRTVAKLQEDIVHFNAIQKYIERRDRSEPGFHDQLKNLFRAEYKRLVIDRGIFDDDLFDALEKFFKDKFDITETRKRNAVRPIITYLFMKCDIFFRTDAERRAEKERHDVTA